MRVNVDKPHDCTVNTLLHCSVRRTCLTGNHLWDCVCTKNGIKQKRFAILAAVSKVIKTRPLMFPSFWYTCIQWNLLWETTAMRDHLEETVLKFGTESPTFQCKWTCHHRTPVLGDHICMANGMVFRDRLHCSLNQNRYPFAAIKLYMNVSTLFNKCYMGTLALVVDPSDEDIMVLKNTG